MSRSSFPRPTQPSPSDPALRRSARFHGNAFAAAARATCFLDAQRGSRGVERGARERERESVCRRPRLLNYCTTLALTVSETADSSADGQCTTSFRGNRTGKVLRIRFVQPDCRCAFSIFAFIDQVGQRTGFKYLVHWTFFFSVSVRVSNCLNPKVSCFCCCCLFVFCFVCGRRGDAEMRKWNRWRFSLRGVFPQY